jgi:hypothetical protein
VLGVTLKVFLYKLHGTLLYWLNISLIFHAIVKYLRHARCQKIYRKEVGVEFFKIVNAIQID